MSTALLRIRRRAGGRGPRAIALVGSAFLRHVRARLWAALTNPATLALLLFGSVTVIPLWWAMAYWLLAPTSWGVPHWYLTVVALPGMYLWAPLLVAVVSGTTLVPRSTASVAGRAGAILPIGPRSRAVAEAVVTLLLFLLARTASLFAGIEPRWEFGTPLAQAAFELALVLPLVLAWAAVQRLDWRGLSGPLLVMCVLPLAILAGFASSLEAAAVVSLAVSALVLVSIGVGIDVDGRKPVAPRPLSFRSSPGPATQFRRDRWFGPLPRLGVLACTVVPFVLLLSTWGGLPGQMLGLLGLLILTVLLFYPFGLKVASAAGVGTVWNGYFGRAWSTLPVRRLDVMRSVYAHGWIMGTALWLLFCVWVSLVLGVDGWPGIVTVVFEFAGIPLVAAMLVCVAAGDGRRGWLALGALLTFQVVLPLSLPVARDLGVEFFKAPEHRAVVTLAGAYTLAILGGLPALTHLRK